MNRSAQRRLAEEAALLMVDGVENEYLHAKHRALGMLGLSDQTRLPSNRKIKECIGQITKDLLGEMEVKRRIFEMRTIAMEIMEHIEDYDPFLIGSTLSGKIRNTSDIDLHAYCDDFETLKEHLIHWGYEEVEEELIENSKGSFVHLKWHEQDYPIEITVYPWSWRDLIPYSSVTGKPMKRADLMSVRRLVGYDPSNSRKTE